MPFSLTRDDILSLTAYEKVRSEKREEIMVLKKRRRLHVGPYAVFLFENKQTLWWQIHEMLRIEKGGEAQILDELSAYGPLVPQGSEWIATLMFEIEDPQARAKILRELAYIEKNISLLFGNERLYAIPTEIEERVDKTGKTSAVHFLRFPFTSAQKEAVLSEIEIVLEISHPAYAYKVPMTSALIAELKQDFEKIY